MKRFRKYWFILCLLILVLSVMSLPSYANNLTEKAAENDAYESQEFTMSIGDYVYVTTPGCRSNIYVEWRGMVMDSFVFSANEREYYIPFNFKTFQMTAVMSSCGGQGNRIQIYISGYDQWKGKITVRYRVIQ